MFVIHAADAEDLFFARENTIVLPRDYPAGPGKVLPAPVDVPVDAASLPANAGRPPPGSVHHPVAAAHLPVEAGAAPGEAAGHPAGTARLPGGPSGHLVDAIHSSVAAVGDLVGAAALPVDAVGRPVDAGESRRGGGDGLELPHNELFDVRKKISRE